MTRDVFQPTDLSLRSDALQQSKGQTGFLEVVPRVCSPGWLLALISNIYVWSFAPDDVRHSRPPAVFAAADWRTVPLPQGHTR